MGTAESASIIGVAGPSEKYRVLDVAREIVDCSSLGTLEVSRVHNSCYIKKATSDCLEVGTRKKIPTTNSLESVKTVKEDSEHTSLEAA